jgi:TolB-like protein
VSLAVLPLNSFSPDPGDEYFADSMTEALVADLAKIEGLRVISRTSTMRYKAIHKSIPEIAHELNVHLIVEGSIVKTRDRVRVTAQLIDGKSDEHVWAGSHDRTIDDLLALQAELASAIAQQVRGALNHTHQEAVYLAQSPSVPRP